MATSTIPGNMLNLGVFTNSAALHNSIYRGKNVGTSVTDEQWAQIKAGTFADLWIGDYWVINSINWRIAAFDYYYKTGDARQGNHHVIIVPDSNLTTGVMNSTNTTAGGYLGSDFYTGNNSNTAKADATAIVEAAFTSSHILTNREVLTNAVITNSVTGGTYACGGAWADCYVELMTEEMVYGTIEFKNILGGAHSSASTNFPYNQTLSFSQLPLFRLNRERIIAGTGTSRSTWWLRDVVSSTWFAHVYSYGTCNRNSASNTSGIRPAFAIYQS